MLAYDINGYSIRGLSRISGVSAETISKLFGSCNRDTSLNTAKRLADALDMTLDDFYDMLQTHKAGKPVL